MAVCAAVLVDLNSQLTFITDEWELLVVRQGWSPLVFLEPFNGHLIVGPALVYKTLLAIFGMGSPLPFQLFAIATHLAACLLLFVWLRARVGDWAALLGAVLILFLGAAFEDLLWAFQVGFFASIAAGLGMLIALDRGDRRGDLAATALLVVSIGFGSIGLVFALGAALHVLTSERRPRWRRSYILGLPIALYVCWWLAWGHQAEGQVSLGNLSGIPGYALDAAAAAAASLFGLATGDGSESEQPQLVWGRVLIAATLVLVGWRVWRERRLAPGLLVALGMAVGFWALLALGANADRPPAASRYQYPGAIFLLMIVAEAIRGLPRPRLGLVIASGAAVVIAISGVLLLRAEQEDRWRPFSETIRYSLAAVEIAGRAADPSFAVRYSPLIAVPVGRHLDAVEAHGSPADSEERIVARPEPDRAAVDLVLAQALDLRLAPPEPGVRPSGCQGIEPTSAYGGHIALGPGHALIVNSGRVAVDVRLRRFASAPSVALGPVEPGINTILRIPEDGSLRPWVLSLVPEGEGGSVELCRA